MLIPITTAQGGQLLAKTDVRLHINGNIAHRSTFNLRIYEIMVHKCFKLTVFFDHPKVETTPFFNQAVVKLTLFFNRAMAIYIPLWRYNIKLRFKIIL